MGKGGVSRPAVLAHPCSCCIRASQSPPSRVPAGIDSNPAMRWRPRTLQPWRIGTRQHGRKTYMPTLPFHQAADAAAERYYCSTAAACARSRHVSPSVSLATSCVASGTVSDRVPRSAGGGYPRLVASWRAGEAADAAHTHAQTRMYKAQTLTCTLYACMHAHTRAQQHTHTLTRLTLRALRESPTQKNEQRRKKSETP